MVVSFYFNNFARTINILTIFTLYQKQEDMRKILLLLMFLCSIVSIADNRSDMLKELDELIADRWMLRQPIYVKIDSLKMLERNVAGMRKVDVYFQLYDYYSHLKADSALYYAECLQRMPEVKNNSELDMRNSLNRAEALALMGAYSDADIIASSLAGKYVSQELRLRYFHIRRTIYGWQAEYLRDTPVLALDVKRKTDAFRDSIILYETDEISRKIVLADKWLANGYPEKAGEELSRLDEDKLDSRYCSYLYYTMSEVYRQKQKPDMQMQYLIRCAAEDMKRGVTEYAALPMLVKMLFDSGDMDRAHDYLICAIEDASYCRSRLRSIEMTDVMPIVQKAHEHDDASREKLFFAVAVCITTLMLVLLAAIFYLYKERNKVARTRKMLSDSNEQLADANGKLEMANNQLAGEKQKLASANEQLVQEKAKLAEALGTLESQNNTLQEQNDTLCSMDRMKEVYIVEYLKRSRTYLMGLDEYRKQMLKVAKSSKIDELVRRLRDDDPLKKEEARFYNDFDTAFLDLHPNFVKHFNAMFSPDDQFVPRRDELLNTELRIFALIRMGVSDTSKIAEFLNCSMPTIYNYRSRIKNKSLLDKDEFEKRLMEC